MNYTRFSSVNFDPAVVTALDPSIDKSSTGLAFGLGVLELVCVILYIIPRTAVLGAILLTGYLGGAILTHLRVGDPFIGPVVFGVFIWGGLFLRDPRVRALIPVRS
ncbi:MAG: DoxX family protein [Nitrospiraceae bacterium]|nr:DoxX family protein [Nitrospiraceae bacterium]